MTHPRRRIPRPGAPRPLWGQAIEVVYHVSSADYTCYMDIPQAIHLALIRHLEVQRLKLGRGKNAPHIHKDTHADLG